jgi:hypothetical protein
MDIGRNFLGKELVRGPFGFLIKKCIPAVRGLAQLGITIRTQQKLSATSRAGTKAVAIGRSLFESLLSLMSQRLPHH